MTDDDWSLTESQFQFMIDHHDEIIAAYKRHDSPFLRQLAATPEYLAVFGDMSFDEAFDRYEEMGHFDD